MKKISIIVAAATNNAIGKDNNLLWYLPEDLKRFKQITSGNTVIMGKNTFNSLPIRPLPNRQNIVITDNLNEYISGCDMAYSIDDSIKLMDDKSENFIIGGGSIYKQFLPLAQKLYITRVHKDFDADVFFPEINFSEWILITSEDNQSIDFNYTYEIYERTNNSY